MKACNFTKKRTALRTAFYKTPPVAASGQCYYFIPTENTRKPLAWGIKWEYRRELGQHRHSYGMMKKIRS